MLAATNARRNCHLPAGNRRCIPSSNTSHRRESRPCESHRARESEGRRTRLRSSPARSGGRSRHSSAGRSSRRDTFRRTGARHALGTDRSPRRTRRPPDRRLRSDRSACSTTVHPRRRPHRRRDGRQGTRSSRPHNVSPPRTSRRTPRNSTNRCRGSCNRSRMQSPHRRHIDPTRSAGRSCRKVDRPQARPRRIPRSRPRPLHRSRRTRRSPWATKRHRRSALRSFACLRCTSTLRPTLRAPRRRARTPPSLEPHRHTP